jgi:hypothetical protein
MTQDTKEQRKISLWQAPFQFASLSVWLLSRTKNEKWVHVNKLN